jgi:sugar lactone lactonase YvrE
MNRFRKWFSQRGTCKKSRKPASRRPWLETLEERVTPSVLIPVTNHRDLVFDASRDALYITTTAGTVQRWDIASQTLLPAYTVGTSLNGADITTDGSALYVGENTTTVTQGFVHKVNLANGTTTNIAYNLNSLESGVFNVVIGPNGLGFVTTEFQGSGWNPLRQLTLSTDTLTARTDDPGSGGGGQVRQNTQIARGADRSLLFFSEANISSGPVFTYNAGTDKFSATETNTNSFIDGELSTVNRNGTLIAMELGSAVSVMDANLHAVANITGADGGLAFDPNLDVLYAANTATNQVTAYDTNTWAVKYRLAIGETIDSSTPLGDGVMRVSNDGKWLFLATPQGVRELALPTGTGIAASVGVAGFPAYVKAGVAGTFQVTVKDPAGNIAAGYTGTVHFTSSDAAAGLPANYTFTAADAGTHTFAATLNTAGTQTITVTDTVNGSLAGTQSSITVHTTATTVIPVLSRRDLVYDPVRGLLYITTTGGTVERFDIANQTLLAPLSVGNSLNGVDITPDGTALYVAEGQRGATQGWFRKVDLATGAVTNLRYDLASLEGGSWNVAIGPHGIGLADTTFEGSGFVPLRQITLSNDALTVRTDVGDITQNTNIVRATDRSLFLFSQSNISSGPLGTYNAANNNFPPGISTNTFLDGVITAVNRNGTLVAAEISGTTVYDQNLNVVHTLSLHGGVAFDPLKDLIYIADSSTSQIDAFDTSTWALRFQLNVPEGINSVGPLGTGVMTVSNDGRYLFLNSPTGVHEFNLPTNFLAVAGFPSPVDRGAAGTFTVTAEDASGNKLTGYTGMVHFTSSDPAAVLPADYTFTAADNGAHTFTATLNTPGTQGLFATDGANGIGGAEGNIVVGTSGPASTLVDTGFPSPITAGTAGTLNVTVEDSLGHVVTSYRGTIHFTSSDGQAALPSDYTFTSADAGVHTFAVTLKTAGTQSLTSTDTVTSSITGLESNITVNVAATSAFHVAGFPSPTTTGAAGNFTVTAEDAFGNVTPTYLGTVAFTSSDAQASLPANYTFVGGDAGTHSFSANLKTTGVQSIIATDTSNSGITGNQSGIAVNPVASDDGLFVSGTYHDVLGRKADAQGLANNLAAIDAARFALLPSFANRFLFSGEYFSILVKGWYQKYLGRAADPGGLAGNVAALQGGAADEQVVANLVGSGEYFAKNGGTNLSFLQAAYLNILGRALDPLGQKAFLGQLAAGVSRGAVAMELLSSGEYRTNLVAGYYSTYLGRTASSADIAAWVGNLANGMRDETVISYFVSSREYFQNSALGGDSNQLWLTSLYQKVLNRAPDAAGLTSNLNGLLNAYAAPRQTESAGLLGANEYRSNLVNGWYQKYLGRAADPAGLAGNVAALTAGTPDEQIIANLVGSGEYFAKHMSTNLGFLQAAYSDILGRALDSAGQTAFLNELASGVSRATVALQLLSSTEYRGNLVGGFYTKLLGRTGTNADIAGWVDVLAAGATDEQVMNAFLTTGEYFLRTHSYP